MSKKPMGTYEAVMIAEGAPGYADADFERHRQAWQFLVDTGLAWQLQGWFGRTAKRMIDAGEINPPQT